MVQKIIISTPEVLKCYQIQKIKKNLKKKKKKKKKKKHPLNDERVFFLVSKEHEYLSA